MGHIGISIAGYLMQISDSMEGVVTAEKMPQIIGSSVGMYVSPQQQPEPIALVIFIAGFHALGVTCS